MVVVHVRHVRGGPQFIQAGSVSRRSWSWAGIHELAGCVDAEVHRLSATFVPVHKYERPSTCALMGFEVFGSRLGDVGLTEMTVMTPCLDGTPVLGPAALTLEKALISLDRLTLLRRVVVDVVDEVQWYGLWAGPGNVSCRPELMFRSFTHLRRIPKCGLFRRRPRLTSCPVTR